MQDDEARAGVATATCAASVPAKACILTCCHNLAAVAPDAAAAAPKMAAKKS